MDFNIHDHVLDANGISITLPLPIKQVLYQDNKIIVLVDDGLGRDYRDDSLDRNIYAFTENGEQVWQVQQCPHGGESPKPYMTISLENKQLIAYNWIGVSYSIDLEIGSVTPYGSGRPW